MNMHHFGDPCIHCGIAHDDVPAGPCQGNAAKAIPIAYRSMGVRWDNVERFLIRMSDGSIQERHHHIGEQAPYYHFGYRDALSHPPRYDETLNRSKP